MNKCAILVNSCDKYADAWPPFFKILKAVWSDCDWPIYLNTESLTCKVPEFDVITLNNIEGKKNIEWGERLIDSLKRIDAEIILFLLEDFFFEEPVKTEVVFQALRWMEEDHNIANINFETTGMYAREYYELNHLSEYKYPGFGLKQKKDKFILAANPGLWRREDLIKVTKPFESAWTWEGYGSIRAQRYPKDFYCRTYYGERPFVYDNIRGGAIHRGYWVGCTVRPLFDKYGIDIDLNQRGVEEDWLLHGEDKEKQSVIKEIKNGIQKIRSLYF